MTIDAKVAEFVIARYKHDRLYGRGQDYGNLVIAGHVDRLKTEGASGVSQFEARSGESTWFRYSERTDQIVVLSETEIASFLERRTSPWRPVTPSGPGSDESIAAGPEAVCTDPVESP